MPARRISDFLKSSSGASSSCLEIGHQLANLQRILVEITPPQLARSCTVGQFARGTLLICADNGAIASKLKQLAPRLLMDFRKRGLEVSRIQVDVQVRLPRPEIRKTGPKISPGALEKLEKLASELSESPLRDAVGRLIRHHRPKPDHGEDR